MTSVSVASRTKTASQAWLDKWDAQHWCGRHQLPGAPVVSEREGDIVTGRSVYDRSQNGMHECNEGDCIGALVVNRPQKLVRAI